MKLHRTLALALIALLAVVSLPAQQGAPPPALPEASVPPQRQPSPEFIRTADQILEQMSTLLSLPIKEPLKKSLRSREEIRAYLVKDMNEDKEPSKRHADQLALERLGLIPKNFPLDSFLLDLLTEQVAGLYDPKTKEFYIADWMSESEQKPVMAHELTHALQDQSFHIDAWTKAARPNDDGELARDCVIEGSALAAMFDYMLLDNGTDIRSLPDVSKLFNADSMVDDKKSPELAKAPPFLRDELLFPYLAGTVFTQQVLKANSGWKDFRKVYENPPASTQQIMHPDLYFAGVNPVPVSLPDLSAAVPKRFTKLDENVIGEFGLHEVLKQFLGETRAADLAPGWAGDRYAIFEDAVAKQSLLVARIEFRGEDEAVRFFGGFSEALELEYKSRTDLFRRPNFFQFSSDGGGVYLRCLEKQCLVVEGADRSVFDGVNRALRWPPAPAPASKADLEKTARLTSFPTRGVFLPGGISALAAR